MSDEPGQAAQGAVTEALRAWRDGDAGGDERLMELVYHRLHRMAGSFLRGERPQHTLQPTALVHEAYLRLVDQRAVDWRSRKHFFAIAARVMRRILVDHARAQARIKRGGDVERVPFENVTDLGVDRPAEVVALDEALQRLSETDPRAASVVELRFFGGFGVDQTAEVLGVSVPTVGRSWRLARAWLYREIYGPEPGRGSRPD